RIMCARCLRTGAPRHGKAWFRSEFWTMSGASGRRMKFSETPLVFLDCQTTGMRPPQGRVLEMAWAVSLPNSPVQSSLVALESGTELPPRVQELTGIQNEDLQKAKDLAHVFSEFSPTLPHHLIVFSAIH